MVTGGPFSPPRVSICEGLARNARRQLGPSGGHFVEGRWPTSLRMPAGPSEPAAVRTTHPFWSCSQKGVRRKQNFSKFYIFVNVSVYGRFLAAKHAVEEPIASK